MDRDGGQAAERGGAGRRCGAVDARGGGDEAHGAADQGGGGRVHGAAAGLEDDGAGVDAVGQHQEQGPRRRRVRRPQDPPGHHHVRGAQARAIGQGDCRKRGVPLPLGVFSLIHEKQQKICEFHIR